MLLGWLGHVGRKEEETLRYMEAYQEAEDSGRDGTRLGAPSQKTGEE